MPAATVEHLPPHRPHTERRIALLEGVQSTLLTDPKRLTNTLISILKRDLGLNIQNKPRTVPFGPPGYGITVLAALAESDFQSNTYPEYDGFTEIALATCTQSDLLENFDKSLLQTFNPQFMTSQLLRRGEHGGYRLVRESEYTRIPSSPSFQTNRYKIKHLELPMGILENNARILRMLSREIAETADSMTNTTSSVIEV